jgi:hypothetical protein
MLISEAILSRVAAVGVGFLLNSTSRVTSWSWVALCLFWLRCCWVRVLLRGGRRGAEPCVGVEDPAGGDGVGETIASSFDCMLGGRCNRSAGVDSIRSGVEDIEGAIELTPLSI